MRAPEGPFLGAFFGMILFHTLNKNEKSQKVYFLPFLETNLLFKVDRAETIEPLNITTKKK